MSGQSLITFYVKYPEMKLIAAVISLRSFWQKWDFISVDKCHVNTPPKWNPSERNVCACKYFIKIKIADQKIKRKKKKFILLAMKTSANRVDFVAKRNFISGFMYLPSKNILRLKSSNTENHNSNDFFSYLQKNHHA